MIAAAGLGLLIGLLLGVLGGGGSILAVPAIVYGVGQPLSQAVPTSLIVVGLAAAIGAIPRIRARQIAWRLVLVFTLTGAPAALAGAAINSALPARAVLTGFALVMIAAGAQMLRDDSTIGDACSTDGGAVRWRRCLPRAAAAGLGVGFLTGLFGVGGGFLIIPALVVVLGIGMTTAIGTSLIIVTLNSASGLLAHLHNTHLDVGLTTTFALAAVLAAIAAGRVARHITRRLLQRAFAYLVLAVAAFVIIEVVLGAGT